MNWVSLTRESIAATDQSIQDLIGLSRDTFRASSFLAQGETGRFCDAPARDRKRFLAEIMDLAGWDAHLKRAREEKREIEDELARIAGQVEQAEGELVERSLIEQEHAEAVKAAQQIDGDLKDATAALTTAREALAEQQKQAQTRLEAEKAVQRAEADLSELRERIFSAQMKIKSADERLDNRETLKAAADVAPMLADEQESLRLAIGQWEQRQKLADEQARAEKAQNALIQQAFSLERNAISALENIGKDTCDRCGQTLHEDAAKRAAESYRAEAKEIQRQADEVGEQIQGISVALIAIPEEEPDRARASALPGDLRAAAEAAEMLSALGEVAAQKEQTERELEEMRAGLVARKEALASARADLGETGPHDPARLGELERAAAAVSELVEVLEGNRLQAERSFARYEAQIERLDKIAAGVKSAVARRDVLHDDLAVVTNLERACGPNGVPALILENVAIPQIEVEASRILASLGGPAYGVELRTLRETKAGDVVDALDIVCLTATGDAAYETFSGGERARIAFALRLALAQLLANRKGSATGLLVIDELEGLDPNGIAALVEVLEDLQTQIPKIILVSHQAELRDAFPTSIVLVNEGGKSRIQSGVAHA